MADKPDTTMAKLFKTIMDASAGKPLKNSVTQKKEEDEAAIQEFIFKLLTLQQEGGSPKSAGGTNVK